MPTYTNTEKGRLIASVATDGENWKKFLDDLERKAKEKRERIDKKHNENPVSS